MTSNDETNQDALRKKRIDLQRKVSLKFKEFKGFVTEFSENLSSGGMFIRTTDPQEPGSVFDFEFTLGEEQTLIHGLGEVVWVREEDEGFDRPAGMGVRFLSLDPESQRLIDRMVAERLERERSREQGRILPDEDWGMATEEAPTSGPTPGSLPGSTPEPSPEPTAGLGPGSGSGPGGSAEPDRSKMLGQETGAAAPERPTGPSPYARSYAVSAGSARASSSAGRRWLVIGSLVVAALVTAAAIAFLVFPDTAMELLVGGGEEAAPVEPLPAPRPDSGQSPEGRREVSEAPAAGTGEELDDVPDEPSEPASDGAPEIASPRTSDSRDAATGAGAADASRPEPDVRSRPEEAVEPVPPAPRVERFTRVQNITWRQLDDELLITIHLDGAVEEWDYSHARVGSPPPRELVRIRGVDERFPRGTVPVAAAWVERIRTGYHPGRGEEELHVVIDLADSRVFLERSEAGDREIRLYLTLEQ